MSADTSPIVEIYGLFTTAADGAKAFFYVGRSENVGRRLREHIYASRKGHEDKYVRIRELDAAGTSWHVEIIESLGATDYYPDAERWHVIRLTREGHTLTNMRHGSAAHLAELAEQVRARHIRNVADVRADRERRQYRDSKMLRRKIWTKILREEGIPDVAADKMLPPLFRRKLLALYKVEYGTETLCLRPMSTEYLMFLLLHTFSRARWFKELRGRMTPEARSRWPGQGRPPVLREPPRWWDDLPDYPRATKATVRAARAARIAKDKPEVAVA
jgi:hypothetical protein